MAHKLAVGVSFIFCFVFVLVLIILYYPKDSFEQELDAIAEAKKKQEPEKLSGLDQKPEDNSADFESRSAFAEAARTIENFGAAFLALGAVICIAVGMACIVCACCIV